MKNVINYKEDQDYQVEKSTKCLKSDYYTDNYKVLGKVYEDDFRIKDSNNSNVLPSYNVAPYQLFWASLSDKNQYESNHFHRILDNLYAKNEKNWLWNFFFSSSTNKHKKSIQLLPSSFSLFPLPIVEMEQLIQQSEYILTLEEGWDGDNAVPIDKEIWETATSFLREYIYFIFNEYNFSLALPEINPGRNNSIDLEWRTEKGRLLINFNNKNPSKAAFYGDRYNNEDCLKGAVDVKGAKEYLAMWMKNCL